MLEMRKNKLMMFEEKKKKTFEVFYALEKVECRKERRNEVEERE